MKISKVNLATFFAATFIPAGVLAGTIVGSLMKLSNPDNIDVTKDLAYLGYFVVPALAVSCIFVVIAVVLSFRVKSKGHSLSPAKLPLTILAINLILAIGILAFRELDGVAQDNWSKDNGRPTRQQQDEQLDQYFEAIQMQEDRTNN